MNRVRVLAVFDAEDDGQILAAKGEIARCLAGMNNVRIVVEIAETPQRTSSPSSATIPTE